MQHFTHEEERFQSDAVNRRMPYGVYLPKGYADEANASKRWPLIIWMHGMWEDHNDSQPRRRRDAGPRDHREVAAALCPRDRERRQV